jgi:hypothetical protein
MKGGKDMTKTYTIFNENDQYVVKSSETNYIEIKKSTLNIDGKKLYDMMFSDFKKGDKITLQKDNSFDDNNKLDNAVYENVKEIIGKIVDGINNSEEIK